MDAVLSADLTRPMTAAEVAHFGPDPITSDCALEAVAELAGVLAQILGKVSFEHSAEPPFTPDEGRVLWRARRLLAMQAPHLLPSTPDPDAAAALRRLDEWIHSEIHALDRRAGVRFVR